jgi:four helix bundle suffix protein
MDTQEGNSKGFIPPHGGYRNLITYKKSEIVYDGTQYFCNRFFSKFDRTREQMIQAARSGKQNIAEASMVSATSKELEIKLTNVARASLEELRIDYEDFLRNRKYEVWLKGHRLIERVRELNRTPDANYETFKNAIEHKEPGISANVMICLVKLTIYLLGRQIEALEQSFISEGGIREKMYAVRKSIR